MGNHCLEGCVQVTNSPVARRGMFIVDRVILRFPTRASLPGGSFCRPLRCVVCTSETEYAGDLFPLLCLHLFRIRFGDVCYIFLHFRVFTDF